MFFQSLTKVAWKKKSEYFQQESNLWPSGPGCLKDGYRYPSYQKKYKGDQLRYPVDSDLSSG